MQKASPRFSDRILQAFGLTRKDARPCSFAFSTKQPLGDWQAFTFSLPVSFYLVDAVGATYGEIRSLASGIKNENYVLVAELGSHALLVLRRPKKEDAQPLPVSVKTDEDYERVAGVIKKLNFTSDELSAHSSLNTAVDLLRVGAERWYVNRGLFANHYLKNRLFKSLFERGRSPQHESESFLSKFGGELPTIPNKAREILTALGYTLSASSKAGYPQYILVAASSNLHTGCIIAPVESLDIKTGELAAPSYQAVASLRDFDWVILTNGRLWRLYSSKVSSRSTNYFEVDIEGIVSDHDQKLLYFVSLFSASSFLPKQGITDIQLTYEGGLKYAKDVEENLQSKIFDKQLFLDLARAILDFSKARKYSQQQLEQAKATALKVLYRIMFILYAESRALLPINNPRYAEISMGSLIERMSAFEKQPEASSVWDYLQELFKTVGKGSPERGVPEYDGALFEHDQTLDGLSIKNRFLVRGIRDLTQIDGRGIDYQNLGVRHLGSLYEALLEYSIRQATQDLVVYRDEIIDASFATDLKAKPGRYIEKGELYLSIAGLARKGTGSYYTPEEIVRFLVRKGLEPHLEARTKMFLDHVKLLRQSSSRNPELERDSIDDLLGIRVLDPAMGSGHFLVTAVEEITSWIISLLKENPEAPLVTLIEDDRRKIIQEQSKKGISLAGDLLTDTVILKRTVMKRCVYGVDVNPLAVELAKLSLWLDSFTIGTPLTFLDHHVRCGDSLIGLWLEDISSKALGTTILDDWTGVLSKAGAELFEMVSMPADLTVEQVRQSKIAYQDVRLRTEALRILLDLNVASILDPDLGKRLPKNLTMIEQAYSLKDGNRPKWWDLVLQALALASRYGSFHWEFEFPDAFAGEDRGFNLVLTNPPWEDVMPQDDDFFSVLYPRFRAMKSKPEKVKVIKKILQDAEVHKSYDAYRDSIQRKLDFFRRPGGYNLVGSGHTNLWKLFLERILKLQADGASLAVVLPSGIITDEGGKPLRKELFKNRIRLAFEFENAKGIFRDLHRSYKFVLLVADRTTPIESFPAAFYLQDVEALEGKTEQDKFVSVPLKLVEKSAPESMSIPEVRDKASLMVFSKLYDTHPLLSDEGKGWSVVLIQELNRTSDSDIFRSDGKGWPLIGGKSFHQFIPDYDKTDFTIDPALGLSRTARHKEYQSANSAIHRMPRLVFRDVASSTNVRAMIACIVPPDSFSPHTAIVVLPLIKGSLPGQKDYSKMICYLAGIFNSFVFDFLIRSRVTMHLSFFYLYQTPVPVDADIGAERITKISARLSSADTRYADLAKQFGFNPGRPSMKERIQLSAELNILVARQYGLTRQELETILQSFSGFEEDKTLWTLQGEIKWSDDLIRKFNGEIRKLVLEEFDSLA